MGNIDLKAIIFVCSALYCLIVILIFLKSTKDKIILSVLHLVFLVAVGLLAHNSFFLDKSSIPPKIFPFIVIFFVLNLSFILRKNNKEYLQKLEAKKLLIIHFVRIPVEIGLFLLYKSALIPKSMTFEGFNFDIISGISALLIFLFLKNNKYSSRIIGIWNITCFLLLLNIVINAALSIPSPLQLLNFNDPNIGILLFPFVFLPTYIVPLVLLSHILLFIKLTNRKQS